MIAIQSETKWSCNQLRVDAFSYVIKVLRKKETKLAMAATMINYVNLLFKCKYETHLNKDCINSDPVIWNYGSNLSLIDS